MRKILIVASMAALALASSVTAQRVASGRRSAGVVVPKKRVPANPEAAALQVSRQREALRYRGLSVEPQPEAEGPELERQERICGLLSKLDFVPDNRLERFRWIGVHGGVITGWEGEIQEARAVPGGLVVTMKVYPRHTAGGLAAVDGHAVEQYLYSGGRLRFLGSVEVEDGRPKVFAFN